LAEECLSLTREVRDEIVALYFRHVHAIFPIIDEYSFRAAYYEFKKEEELLKHIDLLLLQAVIFDVCSKFPKLKEPVLRLRL
jgi:hypothetical protein